MFTFVAYLRSQSKRPYISTDMRIKRSVSWNGGEGKMATGRDVMGKEGGGGGGEIGGPKDGQARGGEG